MQVRGQEGERKCGDERTLVSTHARRHLLPTPSRSPPLLLTHVVKVTSELLKRRISLTPVPGSPDFREAETVKRHLRVDAGTRVAVEPPDAAKVRCGVKELDVAAHLAEAVQVVDAGESTADDEGVEVFR